MRKMNLWSGRCQLTTYVRVNSQVSLMTDGRSGFADPFIRSFSIISSPRVQRRPMRCRHRQRRVRHPTNLQTPSYVARVQQSTVARPTQQDPSFSQISKCILPHFKSKIQLLCVQQSSGYIPFYLQTTCRSTGTGYAWRRYVPVGLCPKPFSQTSNTHKIAAECSFTRNKRNVFNIVSRTLNKSPSYK